ncbi:hypothetical protein BGZ57DRAFT_850472 [Hyaloscypha finlandica]|nr:hypothetical protein BGZ57DRAFT_850472 [Hyaloscypha finlandica]
MSTIPIGPIRKAWYRWKSLQLPWRKRFLVGLDLQGNTFWEFRDTLSSHKNRMRRIVQYPASTHYSDIKISPQWHQWLRHTRLDPPSLTEQSQDLMRQRNLKVLAAEADARWAAKPSFLDAPGHARGQPLPALEVEDPGGNANVADSKNTVGLRSSIGGGPEDISAGSREKGEQKDKIQAADGKGHHIRERSGQENNSKVESKKEKEDPWKQARRGEKWQPAAWDGNIAVRR